VSDFLAVSEVWVVLTNLLVAGAAVAGAAAAWSGLNTWKTQNVWRDDHDLARKALILLHRRKDAVKNVRNPTIWGNETETALAGFKGELESKSDEQRRFIGIAAVYERRWADVQSTRSEIYPLLIEAQVVWECDTKTLLGPLENLEFELMSQIRVYLDTINPDRSLAAHAAADARLRKKRDIMYGGFGDPDEFWVEYIDALSSFESYLKEKLGRK